MGRVIPLLLCSLPDFPPPLRWLGFSLISRQYPHNPRRYKSCRDLQAYQPGLLSFFVPSLAFSFPPYHSRTLRLNNSLGFRAAHATEFSLYLSLILAYTKKYKYKFLKSKGVRLR